MININKIQQFVFYERETWSVTLHGLTYIEVFEKRVLSAIFGPKRGEETTGRTNCVMKTFKMCNLHYTLVRLSKQWEWSGLACRMPRMNKECI
jgi:hypothetical protein